MVRACFARKRAKKPLSADEIHALCRLTWITKSQGEVADNTSAVTAPALSTLLDLELTARSPEDLAAELEENDAPPEIVALARQPLGFSNFYAGFRNISREWIGDHLKAVREALDAVASARTDQAVLAVYERLDGLPKLPRPNAGDMSCDRLLTPLLACLEPRGRAPILNGREAVTRNLAALRLSHATLAEQCRGLMRLIAQAGITDAFDLDTADLAKVTRAINSAASAPPLEPEPVLVDIDEAPTQQGVGKALEERPDEDIEWFRSADVVTMRRLHNTLTNQLLGYCRLHLVTVEEGRADCRFDALVRQYAGDERDLLIEVKADSSIPTTRLAVGQLFDYRRRLPDRARLDLAVLFPEEPAKDAAALLRDVGIRVLWFNKAMTVVQGDVKLTGGT